MKSKFIFLIATGLFFAVGSKAQYGAQYPDNRVVIQGQVTIPGRTVVAYEYHNAPQRRYDEHGNWKNTDYGRYDNRRDNRYDEYDRFCREHRGYRMSREEFYRTYNVYRVAPYCGPKKVAVYQNY